MLNLEDKLIRLVSKHLKVDNSLQETPLSLVTSIRFKDRLVYEHSLSLEPLIPIIRSRIQEE